jgi:organic hydroperoxide reductase OsmC/OhrA
VADENRKTEKAVRCYFNSGLPGLERQLAQALMEAAHETCPYSKATQGNITKNTAARGSTAQAQCGIARLGR